MQLSSLLRKSIQEPSYFFGRFYTLRKQYAYLQKARNKAGNFHIGERRVFDVDEEKCAADLRRDAIAFGINLPGFYVEKLRRFALENPLQRWNGGDYFYHKQVVNGKASSGPVGIAEVMNKDNCLEINEIAHEPSILKIVSSYLGYKNLQKRTNLFWTFAGDLTPEERIRQNQTIEFHFDVHSWNFCYLHFYLTDCDRLSGAHEMVRGSHKNKPAKWLWGSAKKSDAEVLAHYPKDDILTIEGKAGTGFLEDTSCYHRALAPIKTDRLLLQIRYF